MNDGAPLLCDCSSGNCARCRDGHLLCALCCDRLATHREDELVCDACGWVPVALYTRWVTLAGLASLHRSVVRAATMAADGRASRPCIRPEAPDTKPSLPTVAKMESSPGGAWEAVEQADTTPARSWAERRQRASMMTIRVGAAS